MVIGYSMYVRDESQVAASAVDNHNDDTDDDLRIIAPCIHISVTFNILL